MKSYTDIEQSKKLMEILPIESADMHYSTWTILDGEFIVSPNQGSTIKDLQEDYGNQIIPCWSLASLINQLDDEITDNDGNDYELTILKAGSQYKLYYHDSWYQVKDIETDWHDDMIDACVEMIVKLNEKGLI